ncbi:MAG: flagellar biosynthesis protein FlhB [Chlamydiia bacterium]|nr:flagellar biosynthesis protein FlhB [Chlamydiia bacterium]
MAEEFQEKTEEPTHKKLSDARKKGQVAKSQDLTASVVLFAGMLFMLGFGTFTYRRVEHFTQAIFTNLNYNFETIESVVAGFQSGVLYVMLTLLPLFLAVAVASLLINVAQVGWQITTESLKPKWNNLNLFNPKNYKKFFSVQAIVRLTMGFGKLGCIGGACYLIMKGGADQISILMHSTTWQILTYVCMQSVKIGVITAVLLLALGIGDFVFHKWKFMQEMRMTRTEVKDERKQTEGDVQVKSRLRAMMQGFLQNRMRENVPKADVVVANPVHYAIAIKYDPEKMPAPLCVAKGARRLALAIRELAENNGVPVVENPPLAQALYRSVEVGSLIPPTFYHSIAEVLAYVYRLEEEQKRKSAQSRRPKANV